MLSLPMDGLSTHPSPFSHPLQGLQGLLFNYHSESLSKYLISVLSELIQDMIRTTPENQVMPIQDMNETVQFNKVMYQTPCARCHHRKTKFNPNNANCMFYTVIFSTLRLEILFNNVYTLSDVRQV